MSDHARLSLSHSDLWMGCAAWPRMVEGMPEEISPAIQFGNDAHKILENLLLGNITAKIPSNEEEYDCAQVAYDYVQKRWAEMGIEETTCIAEADVKIESTNRSDLWGSADVVLYNKHELEVIDLKSGAGTFVDEQTNGQLMHYAIGALETLDLARGKNQPPVIKLTIVQPRYWGNEPKIRTRTLTPDELYVWLAMTAHPAAMATDDPNAVGTASERCKKCSGRHTCEYRDEAVADALVHDTTTMSVMGVTEMAIRDNQDLTIYDNERLSEVLMMVPVIRDYCDALEEHAQEIILKGEKVAGYKVVSSGGRSKWLNEDAVIDALNKTQVNKNAFKHVLKTPKQVLDLVPKTNKKLAKKLGDLVVKSDGGLTLVMESDARDSVVPSFAPIIQEQNPIETPAELPSFLL